MASAKPNYAPGGSRRPRRSARRRLGFLRGDARCGLGVCRAALVLGFDLRCFARDGCVRRVEGDRFSSRRGRETDEFY